MQRFGFPSKLTAERFVASFLTYVLMCSGCALAQDSHVLFVLSTEKKAFTVGEAIVLTAELKNVGTVPVYVSQSLPFADSAYPVCIRIDFFDAAEHRLQADSFAEGISSSEWTRNPLRLLLLAPRNFYGTQQQALHVPKAPGTYKIVATYFDFASDYFTEQKKKESGLLPYRVLGKLVSNEVQVVITR